MRRCVMGSGKRAGAVPRCQRSAAKISEIRGSRLQLHTGDLVFVCLRSSRVSALRFRWNDETVWRPRLGTALKSVVGYLRCHEVLGCTEPSSNHAALPQLPSYHVWTFRTRTERTWAQGSLGGNGYSEMGTGGPSEPMIARCKRHPTNVFHRANAELRQAQITRERYALSR